MPRDPRSEAIWLFKSAYNPPLRRKILSLLTLPKNCHFETEYDGKWVDDELKNYQRSGSTLEGRKVHFAFIDYSSSPPEFYPIRSCEIIRVQFQEPCRITVRVGSFLSFKTHEDNKTFSQSIFAWLSKNNLIETRDNRKTVTKLFTFCDDRLTIDGLQEVEVADDQTWQTIVNYLVKRKPIGSTHQFDRSIFFRFSIIDDESFTALSVRDGRFILQPSRTYLLRLRVYQPHFGKFDEKETAIMNFAFDEEHIRHIGPRRLRLPLAQRTYTEDFKISVNPQAWVAESHIAFERYRDEYDGPSYQIPFAIPKRWGWIFLRFLPFSLGLILMVLPGLVSGWFNSTMGPIWTTIVTIVGVFLSSISLYRLQSAQA